jgi:hypothetical protein
MGIGKTQWDSLNSRRGKFYGMFTKHSSAATTKHSSSSSFVSFPLFGSDPLDNGQSTAVTQYDVAVNATNVTWRKALSTALNGNLDQSEKMKQQIMRGTSEKVINALGYMYLNNGYTSIAIDIFEHNATAHPKSADAYYNLAEADWTGGDTISALANYNTAFGLSTSSTQKTLIQDRIKRLLK